MYDQKSHNRPHLKDVSFIEKMLFGLQGEFLAGPSLA